MQSDSGEIWHDVAATEDIGDEEVIGVVASGVPVAVFRLGEELHALHDECSHGAARLSDGYVADGCIECPLHQGQFDVRTGEPRCAPVEKPVRVYPVRVHGGRIEILLVAGG